MLYQIVFTGPGIVHIFGDFSDHIQLVVTRKDEYFLFIGFTLKFLFFYLQVDKTLQDFHPAVFNKNVFPQVGRAVTVSIWRIALTVIKAFVKRKPKGFMAFQLGTHKHFVLIYGKMYQSPFFKSKQQLAVIPGGAVL